MIVEVVSHDAPKGAVAVLLIGLAALGGWVYYVKHVQQPEMANTVLSAKLAESIMVSSAVRRLRANRATVCCGMCGWRTAASFGNGWTSSTAPLVRACGSFVDIDSNSNSSSHLAAP